MNPLRRLFSENGISASPARTRTQDARRRARFRPHGEALETRRVLTTFKVNTLLDTVAVNLKTGKDASGHISLAIGHRGSQFQAEFRHDSAAERDDQIDDRAAPTKITPRRATWISRGT